MFPNDNRYDSFRRSCKMINENNIKNFKNNSNFNITFRNSKRRDLNTFLHFGDDKLL